MTITMRERMLGVIRGEGVDRVPFVQYDGIAAPNHECWDLLGRHQMGVLRWSSAHAFHTPHCRTDHEDFERDGRTWRRSRLHTPAGTLTEERVFEPVYGSSAIRSHYVRSPDDYPALLAYLRDVTVLPDYDRVQRDLAELGDDGLPHVALARTPWQQMWVQWVSLTDLSVHAVECPDLVEACLAELERIELEICEVVRGCAAELPLSHVVFPDNITAPAIGANRFERYCVPFYDRLADMLAPYGVPVFVHMDGDLQPLAEAIAGCAVRGIDSLSPPPDNDTSVAAALARWPEMRVWVNFPSSAHLLPPEGVYDTACRLLAEGAPTGRLQIQISENVPRFAWRTSYPEIVRAIRDWS